MLKGRTDSNSRLDDEDDEVDEDDSSADPHLLLKIFLVF